MKRIIIIALAVLMIGGLLISGCTKSEPAPEPEPAPASSSEPESGPADMIELKFSYHMPPQAAIVPVYFQAWADKIEEESGGRVKITHYAGSTLVKLPDQYSGLKSGLSDIAIIGPGQPPGQFPLSEIHMLPYLFPSVEVACRSMWDLHEKYTFDTELKDVKPLTLWTSPNLLLHSKEQVKTLGDIKGIKLRSGGETDSYIQSALGAVPVEMATGDTYTALQKGLIDGVFLSADAIFAFHLQDIIKAHTDCISTYATYIVAMNPKVYEQLPADIKEVIDNNSGQDVSTYYSVTYDKHNQEALEKLKGFDAKVGNPGYYCLPAEEAAGWKTALKPVWDKWTNDMKAKNLPGAEMLEDAQKLADKYK